MIGSAALTPGVARISASAFASSGGCRLEPSQIAQPWSRQPSCVRFETDVPSASTASSVATAKAIWKTVAMLRRLRRPTLRTPIWAVRGRKPMRCSRASTRSAPPAVIDPVVSSASRTGTRTPRRIAGSAASGGPRRPSRRLAATIGRSTPKPPLIAKNVEPKKFTSTFARASPSTMPTTEPIAPRSRAVRR